MEKRKASVRNKKEKTRRLLMIVSRAQSYNKSYLNRSRIQKFENNNITFHKLGFVNMENTRHKIFGKFGREGLTMISATNRG